MMALLQVRLYDDGTKTLLKTLSSGKTKRSTGHSNRIYSVKWKPDDPNVILSGGWDNTVQVCVGHVHSGGALHTLLALVVDLGCTRRPLRREYLRTTHLR